MTESFTLGRLVGRREAFTTVAGRCSAADAAQLREMRDSRLYLSHSPDWGEFCTKYLFISKETANRQIKYLEEFGAGYFEVAQLMRISPTTYRAIAPAIEGKALHYEGEAIALIPENAEKVKAAVDDMRKTITAEPAVEPEPAAPPVRPADALATLEKKCIDVVLQFEAAANLSAYRDEVRAKLIYLRSRMVEIERRL